MDLREAQLVEGIEPIRQFVAAAAIHHFLSTGLYDELRGAAGRVDVRSLAAARDWDEDRLDALLHFLAHEGVVRLSGGAVELAERAHVCGRVAAWYEMLVGGYGQSYLAIGERLRRGTPAAPRDGALVASGSCGISLHDSLPIVRTLLRETAREHRTLLDLGCGSGVYLTELCRDHPGLRAVGIEPDAGAVEAARAFVAQAGYADRVDVFEADAVSFLESGRVEPDLAILCFVIHEVLGQQGEAGVRRLLDALFTRNPDVDLIVVDVDLRWDEPEVMRHPLATTYYNAYYLLHPFTDQRLETVTYWEDLYRSCGLEIVKRSSTDPALDSTGLEVGWLLRREPG